jgi:hypothetical protein
MVASNRSQIQNHDSESIVLTQRQDSCHFRLAVRDAVLLFANSLNTLSENEERFVDACGFDHSLLTVVGAAVVFGASQIDGTCCAYANFVASYLGYLYAEDCVRA